MQDHAVSKSVEHIERLPESSTIEKKSSPLQDTCVLANVLADEVKKAKRQVHAWHETITSRKSGVRRSRMIGTAAWGKSRNKSRKTVGRLSGQKATESKSKFWQLVETSAETKDKSEDKDEDKIPQEQKAEEEKFQE